MSNTTKTYPATVAGLYATKTAGNSRSAILTQEQADRACDAIQKAVGGKLAVKAVSAKVKQEKGDKSPDYFIEAVSAAQLAEERERMKAQNDDI